MKQRFQSDQLRNKHFRFEIRTNRIESGLVHLYNDHSTLYGDNPG